ncbi:MAG: InlB B-repeat-containing protein [Firmicutes bacterium]|nr:InlB B-repeat-containing protein [Bacillota bacterium]
MKRRFLALVLAGCLAAVLSTAAWAMCLNVELPSGETIALDVESGDSIDNVKQKVQNAAGVSVTEQYLYYGGKFLYNGRTLADYNIQKESTLLVASEAKGTPSGTPLTAAEPSKEWVDITEEKVLTEGTYFLCNNVNLTHPLVIQGDVTLDLNGFVLQYENSGANDSVIQVDSGTLTLVDSHPAAIHKFVKEATGLWTLNENAGTEIVKGGVITGGIGREHSFSSVYGSISENGGGGVFINQDASFVMEGGNIVGCSAVGEHNTAGGVLVARSASFVMKAGKIAGCTAARGGGVYVADRDGDYALGSFTMNGGTIEWCVAYGSAAYDDGGGVNNLGSFTMNGGTIRNCTAAHGYGGGISSLRNTTICGDAFVRDCTASQDKSSAMYLNPSNPADRAVIEGGTFRGNIYASPYCTGMVAVTGGTFDPGQPNGITLYTVTFNSNGGSDVPGQIRANAAATAPAVSRAGYTLVGWYTDEACTAAYDFTQPVTDSVTLYAKWEAAPRYYYNSGTTTDTDNADEDKKGSPKTFDPGAGIYAVSVALSLTGTAWIGRKRH